jgi:hypothetical protein
VRARLVAARARDPEVGHHHAASRRDEHVVRLEVAVDDTLAVGRRQPLARLLEDGHDRLELVRAAEPGGEGRPVHELHGDEHVLADRAHVVHRHHVRVVDLGHGPRLAMQAQDAARVVACRRPQLLHGDAAIGAGS